MCVESVFVVGCSYRVISGVVGFRWWFKPLIRNAQHIKRQGEDHLLDVKCFRIKCTRFPVRLIRSKMIHMIWWCTRFLLIWIDLILAAVDYSWSIWLWLKFLYLSFQSDIQPHHTSLQPSVFGLGAFGGFEARQTFDLKVSFTWRVKASVLFVRMWWKSCIQ